MSKRYLVFNANWLGDVLFATPAFRALKRHDPSCYVACVVPPRCQTLLKNNPYVDEVIVFPDKVPFLMVWKNLALTLKLRGGRFDSAIFFQRSSTRTFIARLAGIPERIGHATAKMRWLTRSVPTSHTPQHKTDSFLSLLADAGIPAAGREPDFEPSPSSVDSWARLKNEYGLVAGRYVVVHAGGNWNLKRWPQSHVTQLTQKLLSELDYRVVFCGTVSEKKWIDPIISQVSDARVISLVGKTTLDELALLLKEAALLISNDSGPIHLGASQSVKILGLYGPTRPDLTGPIPKGRSKILHRAPGCELPCYFKDCNYRVCLEWLSPQEVFREAAALLQS